MKDVDPIAIPVQPVDEERLRGAIAFLRSEFRNDGAEGESVHRVCADAETLVKQLAAARAPVGGDHATLVAEVLAAMDRQPVTAEDAVGCIIEDAEEIDAKDPPPVWRAALVAIAAAAFAGIVSLDAEVP